MSQILFNFEFLLNLFRQMIWILPKFCLLFSVFSKLQSDLKTTKVEELKQQMEVFYNEIVRLQNSKDTGMDKAIR